MIVERSTSDRLRGFAADVCVIGSGPVGICTALELAERGLRVLLLESGGRRTAAATRALSHAEVLSTDTHVPAELAAARRLGGTASLWGGRCVPLDPIDFRPRPWLDLPPWPIADGDLAPYLARACELMAAGEPVYSDPPAGVSADGSFRVDALERWSRMPRLQRLHRRALAQASSILVSLHTTALGFDYDDATGRIEAVRLHIGGEGYARVPVPLVVLAAGGNECVRLLLAEQRRRPRLFGGPDGPLGRYYMCHLHGTIADVVIEDCALEAAVDFFIDAHGSYVRRRFVPSEALQAAERLTNIAFWPVVPRIADPAHASGPLSAVFLALSFRWLGRFFVAAPIRERHIGVPPYRRWSHLANIVREPGRTLGFAPCFLWQNKLGRPRLPGLFLRNGVGRYGISYHAEHLPDAESRLTLSPQTDALGLPRLRIDLRFSDTDVASVVRAHALLDAWLRKNALGALDYHCGEAERAASVWAQARHGCHQIGTIRMGTSPRLAVVDADCRSFDVPNLYVVSTAVLPTSGQANPTLAAVQLGLRLADRLSAQLRAGRAVSVRQQPDTVAAAARSIPEQGPGEPVKAFRWPGAAGAALEIPAPPRRGR